MPTELSPPILAYPAPVTVSAIVPARDEQGSIGQVVTDLLALRWADGQRVVDEVIVADNGSRDGTPKHARAAGASVVYVPLAGYGRACWHGAQAAQGEVLLFVDGDGAAKASEAKALLTALRAGADLVVGCRVRPENGAMSWTQRLGNAFACWLMRQLWRMPDRDLGPFRAVRRMAYRQLDMQDRGFGWTVEMQVRAHRLSMQVAHVPVSWSARTSGRSKIGGSPKGALSAGIGILGMIAHIWLRERTRIRPDSTLGQTARDGKPRAHK